MGGQVLITGVSRRTYSRQAAILLVAHPTIRNYGRKKTTTFGRGIRLHIVLLALEADTTPIIYCLSNFLEPIYIWLSVVLMPVHIAEHIVF